MNRCGLPTSRTPAVGMAYNHDSTSPSPAYRTDRSHVSDGNRLGSTPPPFLRAPIGAERAARASGASSFSQARSIVSAISRSASSAAARSSGPSWSEEKKPRGSCCGWPHGVHPPKKNKAQTKGAGFFWGPPPFWRGFGGLERFRGLDPWIL